MTNAVALKVDVDVALPVPAWLPDALKTLLSAAADWEPTVPAGQWGLTLRISDDAEICKLHARFFGNSSPTDVISFPSGDDLSSANGYLGDIIVSIDTARLHADAQGHTLERELAFLALHGLLHVCGHTDATPHQHAAMLTRQTELLERFERQCGRPW